MSKVVKNTTCFKEHKKASKECKNQKCKMWIKCKEHQNCTLIASSDPKTLQQIGNIFGITRMRVCQIEKNIIEKFSKKISSHISDLR
tara:strand:+ start:562 stop:822 length:261 start_codon:yes stop_codon:yes gene_type:complete